LVKTLILR